MKPTVSWGLCALLVVGLAPPSGHASPAQGQRRFAPEEATVATIHAAFASGQLTCVELVRGYLERIEKYDDKGPALSAMTAPL